MPRLASVVLISLALAASRFVLAQDTAIPTAGATSAAPDTSGQVDPSATCPYQVADQIQACRAQVYADEAALPGGPCSSSDFQCLCNVQQGLVACYYPCPGTTPQTDIDYNNANCNGQNGVGNQAAASTGVGYSGSPITTTSPIIDGAASTTVTSTATDSAASTTALSSNSAATTSTAATSSTSSSASVSRSSSAAPSSSTSGSVFNGSADRASPAISGGLFLGFVGMMAFVAL